MGLSSFNRMRREKAKVSEMEAERFKRDNEARQGRREDRVAAHDENRDQVDAIQTEELAAAERIGEKVRAGMEAGVLDEPLRLDHAAEIAGRNIEGVQEPKDPVERIAERIPQDGTANEELVPHTPVENEGPTAEQVEAAAIEAGALPDPATADENVAPEGETASSAGAEAEPVNIPTGWQDSHWRTRVALAERISGRNDVKSEEANAIIEAEEERRG